MKKYIKSLMGFFVLLIVIITSFYIISTRNFDEKVFNKDNVYKNSEILGKIKDNSGQVKFIENYFKTIGISPAAGNGSFIQEFKTINPDLDKAEETANVLGKIEGKNKSEGYLILSSHLDGNPAETSFILEIARTMKIQKYKPEKTVIFALWGGSEKSLKGSEYYAENPVFPLNKSQVVLIDNIGIDVCKNLFMFTYGETGRALMGELSSYSKINGIGTSASENMAGNDNEAFLLKDVPAVLVQGDSKGNYWGDERGAVYKDGVTAASSVLLKYIHRDIYKDNFHGLFSSGEKVFISILIILMLIIYSFKLIYKIKPSADILKLNIESIYYSSIFIIMDKITKLLLTVTLCGFLILVIVYIPNSFDAALYNGHYISNYPLYIIIQNANNYIRDFTAAGFGKTLQGFSIGPLIITYTLKSMALILSSIILSFIIGTLSGTISGFKHKKNSSIRFLGSIAFLSMPDVLVAVLLQLILGLLYKNIPDLTDMDKIIQFLFPLISLTFIPTAYISRIAQVAVREEINKDYITAAKAKGLSDFYILKNHLLISTVVKVVESLPSVLNIIISNLIIVEYFFAYVGIVYQLFHYFNDGDIKTCIGMILGIGMVYLTLSFIFKIASLLINPFKRNGIAGGMDNEKA